MRLWSKHRMRVCRFQIPTNPPKQRVWTSYWKERKRQQTKERKERTHTHNLCCAVLCYVLTSTESENRYKLEHLLFFCWRWERTYFSVPFSHLIYRCASFKAVRVNWMAPPSGLSAFNSSVYLPKEASKKEEAKRKLKEKPNTMFPSQNVQRPTFNRFQREYTK